MTAAAERCAIRSQVMMNLNLSPNARILFWLIDDASWQSGAMYWHWRKMATAIGVGQARFFQLINELTDAGVLAVKREGRKVSYSPISLQKSVMNEQTHYTKVQRTLHKSVTSERRILITETDNETNTAAIEDSSAIEECAMKAGLTIDAAAAKTILKKCHDIDPEASVEEIAEVTAAKVHQLKKRRDIHNPTGLLIKAVPEYFSGDTVRQFRHQTNLFSTGMPSSNTNHPQAQTEEKRRTECKICGNLGYTLGRSARGGTERQLCECTLSHWRESA